MARVLIIEDEPLLRSTFARSLAKLPGVEALDAGTLTEALILLDQSTPQLIISDIDLPDRSGLELLGELGRRQLSTPVLFVSAYLKAYRAQIPPHANVEVLEKPIALDVLRERVRARLHPEARPRTPFNVADYLQLACLGRHSLAIEVSRDGAPCGQVMVVNGQVWGARDRLGAGAEAFGRLAFEPDALVDCRLLEGDPGPRDIQAGWESLLMEAARRHDESLRKGGDVPPETVSRDELDLEVLDDPEWTLPQAQVTRERPTTEESPIPTRPATVPAATAATASNPSTAAEVAERAFIRALDDGVDALLGKRYAQAVEAFNRADALQPGHPQVQANLQRLAQLGFGPIKESA